MKDPFDGSSTGGVSLYEPQPAFQQGVVTQSTQFRTTPDVAYDASPLTGMDVYQTYGNSTKTPWLVVGGTSDASPQWAALLAIADQGRALQGEGPLNNATLEPELYNLPLYNPTPDNPLTNPNTYTHLDFNTIYGGESLGFPEYQATPDSYNLVTGLGSPMANLLIPYLVVGPVVDQLRHQCAGDRGCGRSVPDHRHRRELRQPGGFELQRDRLVREQRSTGGSAGQLYL